MNHVNQETGMVKPRLFPILSDWQRDCTMEDVLTQLKKEMASPQNCKLSKPLGGKVTLFPLYFIWHAIPMFLDKQCVTMVAVMVPRQHHMFKMEQEEYSEEKINWSNIEFIDKQNGLDLTEKNRTKILVEKVSNM
ncbi:hypothetical protein C5167_047914 [Papaver somniferum]|uniref:Myosin motor domain-containing protein n=1 Tax=Papaver somniferum TaxID=3469 RepID=A0A4Y7KKF9_PAPSO|nr:hypothetical protein C5167_047914 [Papaver somniferum]